MPTKVHAHIYNWLAAGAEAKVGLRLFIEYCSPNPAIKNLVTQNPEKHIQIIKAALCHKAGIKQSDTNHAAPVTNNQLPVTNNKTLREDWPFLSEPDCPPELKILVSNKITAYYNYVKAYNDIHKATTASEQINNVSYLVENYIENHLIFKELKHYKKHKKVLGKHPIFAHLKKLNNLRRLPILELVKRKDRIEHNIWRNKNKIRTDNRPDLLLQREKKIRQLEIELAEIIRLLE